QPKVPTVISYDPYNNKSFTWGAQRHKNEIIEGIKLLLDPDQEQPIYVPQSNTKNELKRLGKPPLEVAADYIGAIYQHARSRIETKVHLDYLHMCQKKFVVSVPAVWSDKAMDTTRKAAKMAGIHPITLIKEPEAAALYTLHVLQEKALSVGDAFVLCDAGGGTVDLISYEVTNLSPKLKLKELVPGKGGMAGSLGLNKRFEQAVEDVVGEEQFHTLRKTTGFEQAMLQFDRSIKTAFRGDIDDEYYVNFPMAKLQDDEMNNIQANCWNMKGDNVKGIFQPLMTDIQRLVDDQVNLVKVKRMSESHPKAKEIKAIFLVGGFGSSEYLKKCLEETHPGIQVIQPHDAWSAIVKGAVLSQLPDEATITSSVATRHYGVSANNDWEEIRDRGQEKVWLESHGKFKVAKMTWYIYQGEDLERDHKIIFPFYRSLDDGFSPDRLIFKDELMQSESIQPPLYPKHGLTTPNCTLIADLRNVDRSLFRARSGHNGKVYHDVYYDLAITLQSAGMKFSLEIGGEEIGSVEAKYD
ncbi:hypothetical protein MMC08_004456, partial [Hypocenomyce scalaris]|nr:hypothetical protein [Hypocenomyce scalaris]